MREPRNPNLKKSVHYFLSVHHQGRLQVPYQNSNKTDFDIINKITNNPEIHPKNRKFAIFWINFPGREIAQLWRPPVAARPPPGFPVDPSDPLA